MRFVAWEINVQLCWLILEVQILHHVTLRRARTPGGGCSMMSISIFCPRTTSQKRCCWDICRGWPRCLRCSQCCQGKSDACNSQPDCDTFVELRRGEATRSLLLLFLLFSWSFWDSHLSSLISLSSWESMPVTSQSNIGFWGGACEFCYVLL